MRGSGSEVAQEGGARGTGKQRQPAQRVMRGREAERQGGVRKAEGEWEGQRCPSGDGGAARRHSSVGTYLHTE